MADVAMPQAPLAAPADENAAPSNVACNPLLAGACDDDDNELTDAQKRELRIKGGLRVDAVEGPAARAGLREGDVILAIDNTEVADLRQFNAAVQRAEKARSVTVLVRRGEWVNYVVMRPNR